MFIPKNWAGSPPIRDPSIAIIWAGTSSNTPEKAYKNASKKKYAFSLLFMIPNANSKEPKRCTRQKNYPQISK